MDLNNIKTENRYEVIQINEQKIIILKYLTVK